MAAIFAPINAMSVVTGSGKLAPVSAIPVVVISDGSVPVGPGTAQPVIDVTANATFPRAPVQPIPVVYATGTPPVEPYDPLPVFVVGTTVVTATLDLATVSNATLSGNNLAVTNTGTTSADQGARVATSAGKTSGKYFFETTLTATSGPGGANISTGIGTTGSTYTGMGNGGTTGVALFPISGNVWSNGVNTGVALGISIAPQVFGHAVDLDNRRYWCRKGAAGNWNGSGTADPATNVGGVPIPAGTMVPFVTFGGTGGVANNTITSNYGASGFAGAVPSGFTSGWPS